MTTVYRSDDGKIFESLSEVTEYEDKLREEKQKREARTERLDEIKNLITKYNEDYPEYKIIFSGSSLWDMFF